MEEGKGKEEEEKRKKREEELGVGDEPLTQVGAHGADDGQERPEQPLQPHIRYSNTIVQAAPLCSQ